MIPQFALDAIQEDANFIAQYTATDEYHNKIVQAAAHLISLYKEKTLKSPTKDVTIIRVPMSLVLPRFFIRAIETLSTSEGISDFSEEVADDIVAALVGDGYVASSIVQYDAGMDGYYTSIDISS